MYLNEENNAITGTIGHGRHSVFITAELLSAALRLPIFEPFYEPPTIERCKRMFDQLGYDHSKAGTRSTLILRQCVTPGWKFFTGALCKCVGHKSRSGDQLSNYEQQVVCSLLLNKRLDYGALFFDQLVQLLRANVRADHVPFPRWIAVVFDKFFATDYFSHSGNPIQCPRMSVRMYQDDPLDTDIGISDRMREWIANPYTVPSLTADTDEGGADGNQMDHADQEGEHPSQGEHPSPAAHHFSPRMPPSSPVAPGTSMVQIPASTFSELMSLTRDMSQRLLRIEADVQQIKEVLLLTPPASPNSDDAQKGGDTDDDADADDHADGEPNAHADGEPNEKDTDPANNTFIQHESPNPVHESDSAGHNSPAATEKLFEDSEHDEPDDECQILDMNFIDPLITVQQESSYDLEESHPILANPIADPIIPVQGEDSDIASEESHPLSRKRKVADTELDHSQTDTSSTVKKPKSIVSISNLATEWNMSPDQVKQILDEANQAQLLKNIAQADESLIQHKLQAKGSFEAQMQKFLEFQSKAQFSQPPPSSSKPKTDSVLDQIDRKRFEDVFNRRMCGDKIIKVKASKPRNEKILTVIV
uniref:Uncharacterized protein n=1 Tax=Lactuca sativa TaxID=4236 RepID=A0A9R1WNL0_LACSA|nr:hypothetical protein LSAT_V11C100006880 [Lactuca sativa]